MGYPTPPTTQQGLADAIAAFEPDLRSDERVRDALEFILNPHCPGPSDRAIASSPPQQ